MNNHPESVGELDPERYDPWLEQSRGRHAFRVERGVTLDALGPSNGHELVELERSRPRLHGALQARGVGTFQIAVLDLPTSAR